MLEYAERGNLFNFIRRQRSLSEFQKVAIFEKVCLAVQYLHSERVIHRDIKPENILLNAQFEVKLCDFGWAAAINANEIRNTFCGTYEYMAPEIYRNRDYDDKVDIWSLGILLYELLHGYSPFKGKAMKDVYSNIFNRKIKFEESVCQEARRLISQILSVEPRDRPTVAEILKSDYLQRVLGNLPRTDNDLGAQLRVFYGNDSVAPKSRGQSGLKSGIVSEHRIETGQSNYALNTQEKSDRSKDLFRKANNQTEVIKVSQSQATVQVLSQPSKVIKKSICDSENIFKFKEKLKDRNFIMSLNSHHIKSSGSAGIDPNSRVYHDPEHKMTSMTVNQKASSPNKIVPSSAVSPVIVIDRTLSGGQENRQKLLFKYNSYKMLTDRSQQQQFISRNCNSPQTKINCSQELSLKRDKAEAAFPPIKKDGSLDYSCENRVQVNNFCQGFRSPQLSQKLVRSIVQKKENLVEVGQQKHYATFLAPTKPKANDFAGSFLKKVSKNALERVENQMESRYLKSFQGADKPSRMWVASKPNVPEFKGSLLKSIKENLISQQLRTKDKSEVESIACTKGLLGKILERQKNVSVLQKTPVLCKAGIFAQVKASSSFDKKSEGETIQNFKKKGQFNFEYD